MNAKLNLIWPFLVAGLIVSDLCLRLFISYKQIYNELKLYDQELRTWEAVRHFHQSQIIIYAVLATALIVFGTKKMFNYRSKKSRFQNA